MIKTVSLTADTETKVEISGGYNVAVINRTTGMLYASRKSGISAGADDVAAIPAGDSYVIRAADDTVYLLATAAGDVQLESIGAKEVFKIAAARSSSGGGEGGTVDEVARQAISSHANNDEIHLTAEDAVKAAATAISNPNLLINPDSRINQRGQTEYVNADSSEVYSFDMWTIIGTVRKTEDNVIISPENSSYGYGRFLQHIPYDYTGVQLALSAKINGEIKSVTGVCSGEFVEITNSTNDWRLRFVVINSETIVEIIANEETTVKWAKLELGSVATPFVPPNPATELAKCQRYFYSTYQGVPAGTPNSLVNELVLTAITDHRFNAVTIDLPAKMRTTPTVTFYNPQTGEEGYAAKSGDSDNPAIIFQMSTGTDRLIIGSENLAVGTDYYLHYTASAEL